jgi:predicted nuclease of predicted toxin-antitoxin system
VKLLFDENVSPRLVGLLEEDYPGRAHVRDIGLRGAPDRRIWDHARENTFVIVSKDDDFRQRSIFQGAPPKVIWLQEATLALSRSRTSCDPRHHAFANSRTKKSRRY